jgi:hypothetical protein
MIWSKPFRSYDSIIYLLENFRLIVGEPLFLFIEDFSNVI